MTPEERKIKKVYALWCLFFCLAGFPLFMILDKIYYPDYFAALVTERLILIAYYIVLLILILTDKIPNILLKYTLFIIFPIAAAWISYMTVMTGDGFDSQYFAGLFLAIIAAAFLIESKAIDLAISSLILLITHFSLNYSVKPVNYPKMISQSFFLVFACFIAVLLKYFSYKILQEKIAALKETERLNKEKDELIKKNTVLVKFFSHDTKNAMSSLIHFLSMIPKKKDDVDWVERNSIKLKNTISMILGSIEDTLEYNKPPRGKAEKTNQNNYILAEIINCIQFISVQNISFNFDFRSKNFTLINSSSFSSILNNIIKNAFEAVNEGGTIRIMTKDSGNFVEIGIENTGSYIPEDQRRYIFDAFVSNKKSGTGIGLASAKNKIQAFGGSISFESSNENQKKTKFIIQLPGAFAGNADIICDYPLFKDKGDVIKYIEGKDGYHEKTFKFIKHKVAKLGRKINIVVVDDETTYKEFFREMITSNEALRSNIRIFETYDTISTIELMEREQIDYAFVDLNYEKNLHAKDNGLEISKYIERVSPDTKIIIHSSITENKFFEMYKEDIYSFYSKPIKLNDLLTVLK